MTIAKFVCQRFRFSFRTLKFHWPWSSVASHIIAKERILNAITFDPAGSLDVGQAFLTMKVRKKGWSGVARRHEIGDSWIGIGHILPVKGNADTFSPTSFNVNDFLSKKRRPKNSTGGFRLSTVRSCPSLPTWWSTIRPFDHQSSRAARQSWPINSQLICGIGVVQPWFCVYV